MHDSLGGGEIDAAAEIVAAQADGRDKQAGGAQIAQFHSTYSEIFTHETASADL